MFNFNLQASDPNSIRENKVLVQPKKTEEDLSSTSLSKPEQNAALQSSQAHGQNLPDDNLQKIVPYAWF